MPRPARCDGIVEDCPSLDAGALGRRCQREAVASGKPGWRGDGGATVTVRGPEGAGTYRLVALAGRFNNVSWYFVCPNCGTRRRRLYRHGGPFACRGCLKLLYRTQVRRGVPVGLGAVVRDWLLTPEGARFLAETGYVPGGGSSAPAPP